MTNLQIEHAELEESHAALKEEHSKLKKAHTAEIDKRDQRIAELEKENAALKLGRHNAAWKKLEEKAEAQRKMLRSKELKYK
jgi:hypothetical protein